MIALAGRFIAILSLTFFCGTACAEDAKTAVLGRIGDTDVTAEDLRLSLDALGPPEQAAVLRDPALLSKVVRAFLVQKLVLKEALAKKWEQQPAVVVQIERTREAAITGSFLQSVSQPSKDYPSEAEARAAYDANKAALLVPRSFRLAQIFVSRPKGSGKENEKLKAVLTALAKAGADFASIARENSEEPDSASRGGEIGWLAETQIQPEIRAKLPKLSLNVVSAPVELNDGWHILKVLDAREPFTPPFEQVKDKLAEQMRAERVRMNTQAYIDALLKEHPLTINELALSKLLPQPKN